MRINYNFPYFQKRLSSRQKARLTAEFKLQRPEIIVQGQTIPIIRIRSSVSHCQSSEETN